MRDVYLLSLQYKDISSLALSDSSIVSTDIAHAVQNITKSGDEPTLQVRAGYMGLCIMLTDGDWVCSTSASSLANIVKLSSNAANDTRDPLNLVSIANNFKEDIVFDGLLFIVVAAAAICFLMLATFPGWHEELDETGSDVEIKPFPSRPVSHAALATSAVGFSFGLIAALWQHINSAAAASMAEKLSYGQITGHVGPAAMAFGWIGVVLIGVVAHGLLVMIMSISLIRKLTYDE
ncbi:Ca2+ regulator and membrane fusion protein Fig1-domain-containing protein [Penicillium malachiteum]|uniref:Ca2+ regulator and membrane fusion protein Fig1-domain-containing protein n=1 Tax=Penicillium malachiteum TaxID=1324776 RepID=UPI0025472660|nr:Ca2+ regulator and membrane fusion protein Fig1-domain-containing protein [Penicillium malachiteum]KAJ5736579.1 Ca2+ regulator and membrane fusion protein Fig1-domain-containing protein [Penicillium malachiteum]